MEAEFASAQQRMQRERDRQLDLARRRAEKERLERAAYEQTQAARETAKRERELREAQRREDEELEMQANGGFRLEQMLRAFPDETLESNKVTLPPSMLAALAEKDALSTHGVTFELALIGANGEVESSTCAGVQAFTADEGTILLPVKTALSLSKGARHLDSSVLVRVKYIVVDRHAKVTATVQPLGDGFHLDGANTVNIDLQAVLSRALRNCMVISEGDFIPLRHEGKTYTLVVRKLQPEQREMLTDTELSIDLLPCENVTLAQEAAAEAERLVAERRDQAAKRLQSLPPEPLQQQGDTLLIRARLPSGSVQTRRFTKASSLGEVLEWASALCEAEPRHVAVVVPAAPGQPQRVFGTEVASQSLGSLGFASSTGVMVRVSQDMHNELPPPRLPTPANSPWTLATRQAESQLDKHLEEEESEHDSQQVDETSSVEMFKLLVDAGAKPSSAGRVCQRFLASLRQLKASGLLTPDVDGARVVALVERFNGGVTRVADALLSEPAESELTRTETPARDWTREISSLGEMGLDVSDQRKVVSMLEQHGGDLQRVVDLLLAGG